MDNTPIGAPVITPEGRTFIRTSRYGYREIVTGTATPDSTNDRAALSAVAYAPGCAALEGAQPMRVPVPDDLVRTYGGRVTDRFGRAWRRSGTGWRLPYHTDVVPRLEFLWQLYGPLRPTDDDFACCAGAVTPDSRRAGGSASAPISVDDAVRNLRRLADQTSSAESPSEWAHALAHRTADAIEALRAELEKGQQ